MITKQTMGQRMPPTLLVLLVLLAAGCGGPSTAPVTEEQALFPKARFLQTEGYGKTPMEARRQALAELSAVFESRVSSHTISIARSSLGPDNVEQFEKTIESNIRIVSSVRLKGAIIGKVWQDKTTGLYHALAVLDRMDAGRDWTGELEILDNRVQAETAMLATLKGRLPRMASLNRIMSLFLEHHAIESRLMVIDYPSVSNLDIDMSQMMSDLVAIRSELKFYIDITGEHGETAGNILSQTLTQNGIFITRSKERANALITGRIDVFPLNLNNPEILFVRAVGDVQVFEIGSRAVFTKINENIRKGHVDPDEAVHKAVMAISQIIADRLVSALGLSKNI